MESWLLDRCYTFTYDFVISESPEKNLPTLGSGILTIPEQRYSGKPRAVVKFLSGGVVSLPQGQYIGTFMVHVYFVS